MKSKLLTVMLLSIMHGQSAFAEDDFDGLDFSPELPIVISASRLSQSVLTSPSSVTVIDSAMIEASGFTEFVDILRLVPGFVVGYVDGAIHAAVSHGEGWEYPNRMQLLIDGRSTYTNALTAIDWTTIGIHLEDIDRIEVVRGPAASAYGSNSYAAAINVITRAPALDDKFMLRARTGNKGEKQWLMRHSGSVDKLDYRISASTRENTGIEDQRDTRDLNNLAMSAQYHINTKNSLWGSFSYTEGDSEIFNVDSDFFPDSLRKTDAWSGNLRWDHYISDSQELKINLFHNYFNEDDMVDSYLLSDALGVSPAVIPAITGGAPDQSIPFGVRTFHSHRTDLEVEYTQLFESGLQYIVGTGIRYDTMRSESLFPKEGTATNTSQRVFGNMQIPIFSYLTANIGGLYELNQTERPHFSPRGSLNFHLNQFQSIRLGYSKAHRIPSLLEENIHTSMFLDSGTEFNQIYITDGDDLHAETVRSIDISYLGRFSSMPINWEFRAYREKYRDTVFFYTDAGAADIDGEVNHIGNAGNSTMYGFEGEVTFRPDKFDFVRLHFNTGHMTGSLLTDINRSAPLSETQFISLGESAPENSGGILASKRLGSWQFNVGYYHVGQMKWLSQGDEVDSYNRLDASISKSFALTGKQQLVVKFAGQNILNKDYNEFNNAMPFNPFYYASISFVNF